MKLHAFHQPKHPISFDYLKHADRIEPTAHITGTQGPQYTERGRRRIWAREMLSQSPWVHPFLPLAAELVCMTASLHADRARRNRSPPPLPPAPPSSSSSTSDGGGVCTAKCLQHKSIIGHSSILLLFLTTITTSSSSWCYRRFLSCPQINKWLQLKLIGACYLSLWSAADQIKD